jgi:hypothetical protein
MTNQMKIHFIIDAKALITCYNEWTHKATETIDALLNSGHEVSILVHSDDLTRMIHNKYHNLIVYHPSIVDCVCVVADGLIAEQPPCFSVAVPHEQGISALLQFAGTGVDSGERDNERI